ncbi:Mu transposase C-terminal domain-containing protein [Tistrella mobilis]|uniref:Mu transposase C-terminal domain-containing protein n=1 Tax=Tistrella mobilis TaxID=171437 RepID=UPI0035576FD1
MTGKLLSAREIADALGIHKRAVQLRADRGSWPHVIEAHTNGRPIKLYDVTRLPAEVREELARRELATQPQPENQAVAIEPEKLPEVAPTPAVKAADWQRRAADARAALLAEVDRLAEVHGSDRAIRALVSAAADGSLGEQLARLVPLANARSAEGGGRTLSERTVKRWRAQARETGWVGLLPKAPPPAPEPAWAPHLLSIYRERPASALTEIVKDLKPKLPTGVPAPTYSQARSYLDSLPPQVRERGRVGPNAMLALRGHKRRSSANLWPMDLITGDGHTLRWKTQHPVTGNPFQCEVVALLDIATRYTVGWSAGLSENTWVVMDAFRHTVERWGVPAAFYSDNGPGFTNLHMSADMLGLMARCGTLHETSIPGRPQSRGKIERAQSTIWGPAERRMYTYVGPRADRDIVKRRMTQIEREIRTKGASRALPSWEQTLAELAAAVEDYNNRPHSSLKRIRDAETGRTRHQTPHEAMREAVENGWRPSSLPAELIEDLFRPYEERTTIRGEVRLPWGRYYDDALVPLTGQRVRVGYDIHDGERVWVRDGAGRLVCVAHRDANVIPDMPDNKLAHVRDQRASRRAALLDQRLDDIEIERRGVSRVIDVTPAPAEPGMPKITSIPQPAAPVRKPQEIASGLSAAAAEWQRSAQVVEIRPGAAAPAAATEAEVRYARAREIERRVAAGESITESEASWLAKYQTRPEYRVRRDLEEQRAAILAR